jgi:hypothetical protein
MTGWLPMRIGELVKRMTSPSNRDKALFFVATFVVFALVVDMELSNVSDLLQKDISSRTGIFTFILISCIYLIGQYILIRTSKAMTSELRSQRKDVIFIDTSISIIQAFIIILFVVIIIEITLGRSYDLVILVIITIVSNGLSAVLMMFLFKRLLKYYKLYPDRAVLSYAISGLIISITSIVTIFFMVPVTLEKSEFISADVPIIFPAFSPGSPLDILNYAFYSLSVITFLSVWFGTVLLLSHYSQRFGKVKFWIIMSLPLVFYLSQIIVISFPISFPFVDLDKQSFIFYYRVVFTVSSTIGGILFGQPFFLISRMIPHNNKMHRNLIILGLGMVLYFVSGSATVYHAPFPPFGLANVALIGFSSYFMFLGLYSSTISLSQDSELHRMIRKSAIESKFFLKLSDAELENTILNKVQRVKKVMTTESGITPSLTMDDAKGYLLKVLDEMTNEKQ